MNVNRSPARSGTSRFALGFARPGYTDLDDFPQGSSDRQSMESVLGFAIDRVDADKR